MLNGKTAKKEPSSRAAHLATSLSGTNLVRAADHNQRAVLQAIRLSGETTRVALVRQTGLTAPSIANITGRLTELGLIKLIGRHRGLRGQPALRLAVDPDGAFSVGLNIDRDHITMVVVDLAGEVRGRASREMDFAMPAQVTSYVRDEIDTLIASAGANRDRILGVGVAVPDDLGKIALPHRPAGYEIWNGLKLDELFTGVLPWPIYVDNDAAAAAIGEAQCNTGFDNPTFFYLLISAGLGGGPVIEGRYYRGAELRSGEIGLMPDPTAATENALVQDTVSLSALRERLEDAGRTMSSASAVLLDEHPVTTAVVDQWLADARRALTAPLIAINCLINPNAVLIGGRLPTPLIERLAAELNAALRRFPLPALAPVCPAAMANDAPAIGAAILPFLNQVLPSDAILIQAANASQRTGAPQRTGASGRVPA